MDDEGYLYIVDRKKDMIIAGGFNIYPREIDEILYEHPKIKEVCAVGLPDPYRGETMTADELIAYCREKLTGYKVPKTLEFMDELPKSAIGKVLRKKLREMEAERSKKQP